MVINRKIIRTMMENKSQYMGSLLLIIISCMMYTMFNQLGFNLDILQSSFVKNNIQEDSYFIVDKRLVNIPKLESRFNMLLEETRTFDYSVAKDKNDKSKIIRVFSQNEKINIPAVVEGEKLGPSDILIDPAYAKANNIRIGDSIKIYSRGFKVSGFLSLPNYIYPLKSDSDLLNDPLNFGVAVISLKDFNSINLGSRFYSTKFLEDEESVDSRKEALKDYLKNHDINVIKWVNSGENRRISYIYSEIDSIKLTSSSLPVAILILTCILSAIVMWRMLKKESIIIGTLYALGYRKSEIMKHYMCYSIIIAFVGGIIGTVLGLLTFKPMLVLEVSYYNMPMSSTEFSLKYTLISVMLPVFFLGIFSFVVISKALRSTPLELMRGGKGDVKVGFLEKYVHLNSFSFNVKFKIRELLRSIPRTLLLLNGVIAATMLLLLGFSFDSSMDYLLKDTYEYTYKYQYQYLFNSFQQGKPARGEPFSIFSFNLESNSKINFAVFGMSTEDKYINLKDEAGNRLTFDKVIITKPLADKLSVKPGDSIKAVSTTDSKTYSIKVDCISESYVGEYIYMPLEKINNMLKYPTHSYIGIWSIEKLKFSEDILLSTTSIDDFKNSFNSMTAMFQMSIGVISLLSFLIGLIVIYVVTSMIIEENKKTISLLKIFGYKKREVNSLILNSSSFIIILGYFLGVPLISISLEAMFKSITKEMGFTFPVNIERKYIFIGFIIIYMSYELSKALSKRKINRISMNEVLKSTQE